MRKRISQREARRTSKRADEFERKYIALMRSFTGDYPGVHLKTIEVGDVTSGVLNTAVRLAHPLAAKIEGNKLEIYALKP